MIRVYCLDESDAKELAEALEQCNIIISDQWNYVPGDDLTKYATFFIYSSDSFSDDEKIGTYSLNGKDDKDTIYNELIRYLQ